VLPKQVKYEPRDILQFGLKGLSYAEHCISYDRFSPSVCHSQVSCQNNSSYNHAVFIGG